jgi:hypothetical protein
MLKVPTFIIGGLLILTGIAGYLLQDLGLSLKLKGPLAEDAEFTLSDGNQTHVLDLGFPSSDAAGEHAYWIAYNLNLNHAKDASQGNYAIDEGATDRGYIKKSFWYASSKGDTMSAMQQESENFQGAGQADQVETDWATVDANSSTIRFIFKDQIGSPGPVTFQSSNWKNIDITPTPKPNQKITFYKSWTAFIPGILGIVLILLAIGADKMPKAHKHFMHVAVLIGLLGFFAVAGKVGSAVGEMNWLKSEPYMIIQVSSLKPTTMLLSAGLLLIFVILCVVSFIEARKNRVAEEKKKTKASPMKKDSSKKEDPKSDSEKKEKNSAKEDKKDSSKSTHSKDSAQPKSKDGKKSEPSDKKVDSVQKVKTEKKDSKVPTDKSGETKSKSVSPTKTAPNENPDKKPSPKGAVSKSEESNKPTNPSKKPVPEKKEVPPSPPSKEDSPKAPTKETSSAPKPAEKVDTPQKSEEDKKTD